MNKLLSCLTALAIVLGAATVIVPAHAQSSYNWNTPNSGGGGTSG